MSSLPERQRGIGLPAAIFVITIMATLAVAINALISDNARLVQEEIQLTRAFYAAESVAGVAMNARFPPDEFPQYSGDAICPDNAGSPREYEFRASGLRGCRAAVSCAVGPTVNGTEYYTITGTGTCGEVSRTVQVRTSY
jgi:MSHA biogenesis protein MshP